MKGGTVNTPVPRFIKRTQCSFLWILDDAISAHQITLGEWNFEVMWDSF